MRWVRWYSKQSCQWSKWRWLGQDWLDSDPTVALRMSHGQRVQFAHTLPDGAKVKGTNPLDQVHVTSTTKNSWRRTVSHTIRRQYENLSRRFAHRHSLQS